MYAFKSNYKTLTFYVNEKPHKFEDGFYRTEDKKVVDVLKKLKDVELVEEPKKETKEKTSK